MPTTKKAMLEEWLCTWWLFRNQFGFDAEVLFMNLTPDSNLLQLVVRTQDKEAAVIIGHLGPTPDIQEVYSRLCTDFGQGAIKIDYEKSRARENRGDILKNLLRLGFVVPNMKLLEHEYHPERRN